MSYLARLRAKISPEGAIHEPTKPTKPSNGSFVSTPPAPSRQISAANDDSEPAQDLPLLAACEEYQALIERLCDLSRYDDDTRRRMHAARCRMSPESLWNDLPRMQVVVHRSAKLL